MGAALITVFISQMPSPPANATSEPTLRSMPPRMMTNVMPMATTPRKERSSRTFSRFSGSRNRRLKTVVTPTSTTSASSGPKTSSTRPAVQPRPARASSSWLMLSAPP